MNMVVEQKSVRFKRQFSARCTPPNRDIQPTQKKKKSSPSSSPFQLPKFLNVQTYGT